MIMLLIIQYDDAGDHADASKSRHARTSDTNKVIATQIRQNCF